MDSEALRTFLIVQQTGGFSAAAERLLRSQPAISRRIAQLEADVGAPLFERAAGGVVLSQAGRVLLPYAERVMAALKDAEDALGALAAGAGPVSLAAVGTLAGERLTGALIRFGRAFPDARLALRTAASAEVSDLVRTGEVAIGLRYFDDPAPDLTCEILGRERLVVACGCGHPSAGRTLASLRLLRGDPWMAFPDLSARREVSTANIFAQFLAQGVAELNWTPVDSLTAQKRLIEAGFGLALLPESAIEDELRRGSLATIAIEGLDAANPIAVITRRNGYLSPAAVELLALLRGEFAVGS